MKIRNGFVSNSSSSSFMIYGAAVPKDMIAQALVSKLTKKEIEELELDPDLPDDLREEQLLEIVSDDLMYSAEGKFKGLEFHGSYDWDDFYVGLSWDQIKDDETGKEFKARVASLLKDAFGTAKKDLATHSEVIYDG